MSDVIQKAGVNHSPGDAVTLDKTLEDKLKLVFLAGVFDKVVLELAERLLLAANLPPINVFGVDPTKELIPRPIMRQQVGQKAALLVKARILEQQRHMVYIDPLALLPPLDQLTPSHPPQPLRVILNRDVSDPALDPHFARLRLLF
jgi:hypothetical protein